MTEQQNHLQQLLERQNQLSQEIQTLNSNASASRDLFLKVQGAIEYLQEIGVTLPEQNSIEEVYSDEESSSDEDNIPEQE
jgi:Tfp pilus assembly protein PilN